MNGGGLMTAFDKCTAALGSYKIVRKFEEKLLLGNLHFIESGSGRLDFRRYKSARDISLAELSRLPDFTCCIVFPDGKLPSIKCRFKRFLACLDEVLEVSRVVWIADESRRRVIEFYHGEITACDI